MIRYSYRVRWNAEQLQAHQTRQLDKFRKYVYRHSPFYRQFHKNLFHAPLKDLPVLNKKILMENYDEIVTDRKIHLRDIDNFLSNSAPGDLYLNRYVVCPTSGSSGTQGIFLWNRKEWVNVLIGYIRILLNVEVKLIFRRVKHAYLGSTLLFHISSLISSNLKQGWHRVLLIKATDPIEKIIEELNRWQPEILHGYASLLATLAGYQKSGELKISPRYIITNAELLTEERRKAMQAAWGVNPFDSYISTEGSVMAFECTAHGGMHVGSDAKILEVVDQKYHPVPGGQLGDKVLITNLFNYSLPLIRYEIDDRIRIRDRKCECGINLLPMVEEISGREYDRIKLPTAKDHQLVEFHILSFCNIFDGLATTGWQVIHEKDGSLTVLFSSGERQVSTERIAALLKKNIEERGAIMPPVKIKKVPEIPKGKGGKTPLVISKN